MKTVEKENGWIEVNGPVSRADSLRQSISIDCEKLSIVHQPFLSKKLVNGLKEFKNIRELWLWCDVGRAAVKQLLSLPKLEKLDILEVRAPGRKMSGFGDATNLREFRCNHYMSVTDLHAIAQSKSIRELGAHYAGIDTGVINAILSMPELVSLDLEGCKLDDDMASAISQSNKITSLWVGATKVTTIGFEKICNMPQLKSLDAWAIQITESDLEMLANLDNLEFLSLGGYEDQERLTAKGVLPRLADIPSLKRVWLDGILISESDQKLLKDKYEYVSIT